MANVNKVMLIGRLTRDPELRYTPSGKAVCELGLAINRTYKKENGEEVEDTCYVDITAWGRRAEVCSEYLQKGRTVYIEGRLRYEKWDAKDGGKRSKMSVVAQAVQFLSSRKNGSREESQETVKV
ncbi:single-stranded DNA-binding protein [Candidatus Peregrinibacteria bacterium]|nr:single-stranded DNA-binding protein [Candidatus Peregrinibacteria bacterium]